MGPIKITAPPLAPVVPPFSRGPIVIRSMPTKIMTKAKKSKPEAGTREDLPSVIDAT